MSYSKQTDVGVDTPTPKFTLKVLWTDTLGRLGTRAGQIILVGFLLVVILYAITRLTVIVIPTLVALILTCALWPVVHLCRKVMNKLLAAWVTLLGSLIILGGVITALVFSVINEWPTLVSQASEGFAQVLKWANGLMEQFNITITQEQVESAIDTVVGFLTSAEFGAGAVSTISATANFFTGLVLFIVILFFFLKDGDTIWAFFVSWTPGHTRLKWILSGQRAQQTFGGYIRGTAIVAAVDAVGITIALLIMQVPLAIPLGVIVFLGAFIPMVGATIAGALATLVALVSQGWVVALVVLGAVILIQQLEGNFLQPVVMAQTLSLHALIVLMALTAGTILAGLPGAVLAVPIVAVLWAIVKVWTDRDGDDNAKVNAAEDQISDVFEHEAALEKAKKEEEKAQKKAKKDKKSAGSDKESVVAGDGGSSTSN